MTSSISSLDELASGLPTGFILMPTTSPGSKKRRQASTSSSAPVSSFIPRATAASIASRSLTPLLIIRGIADLDDPAGVGARDAPLLVGAGQARGRLGLLGRDIRQGHPRQRGDRGTGGQETAAIDAERDGAYGKTWRDLL